MSVLLETSLGDIVIDLLTEERPRCCKNFLKLCKIKYYNFCLFHSVQRNLVAQTGDPTGTGKGGESLNGLLYGEQAKYFDMEVSPRIRHKKVGLVSMVNNGSSMHGSQFFFTLGENLDYLDSVHTVFGEVAEGMDILMKINEAYCDTDHRPFKDIRIYHTILLDDPYDDPAGLQVPDRSPEPTKEQLDSGRIGADEEIDDFKGMSGEQVQEMIEEREAKANAQILAMVGDIPEEDIAPPENVLFVCKLNPVTTDEDLEIIFSRFGNIKSCEVIRDQKTKESLQYAFIEFDNPHSCENAYFKMDNVLIDDRRIHVDFSQSVSKFKWKGKGRGVEVKDDEEKDSFASKYRIKDNSRKDNRYDLVFEEEEEEDSKKKKRKKKKNKTRASSSDSEHEQIPKKKKSKHMRSESPVDTRHKYNKGQGDKHSERKESRDAYKYSDRADKYSDRRENRDRGGNYGGRSDDRGGKYSVSGRDKGDKYSRDRDKKYRDESGKNRKRRDDSPDNRYRRRDDSPDDRYRRRADSPDDRLKKRNDSPEDRYRSRDDKRSRQRAPPDKKYQKRDNSSDDSSDDSPDERYKRKDEKSGRHGPPPVERYKKRDDSSDNSSDDSSDERYKRKDERRGRHRDVSPDDRNRSRDEKRGRQRDVSPDDRNRSRDKKRGRQRDDSPDKRYRRDDSPDDRYKRRDEMRGRHKADEGKSGRRDNKYRDKYDSKYSDSDDSRRYRKR